MRLVLLVRHAAHDQVATILAGRMPGVNLGAEGRAQAARLADRLRGERLEAVQSSPRARTLETAEAIATAAGLPAPTPVDALDEIDFGAWSGQGFDALDDDPRFRQWNASRATARAPGGESMGEVQVRAMAHLAALGMAGAPQCLALVTHADVIKAVVCHVLGLSLDAWWRFHIAPASITRVEAGPQGFRLTGLNEVIP